MPETDVRISDEELTADLEWLLMCPWSHVEWNDVPVRFFPDEEPERLNIETLILFKHGADRPLEGQRHFVRWINLADSTVAFGLMLFINGEPSLRYESPESFAALITRDEDRQKVHEYAMELMAMPIPDGNEP